MFFITRLIYVYNLQTACNFALVNVKHEETKQAIPTRPMYQAASSLLAQQTSKQ